MIKLSSPYIPKGSIELVAEVLKSGNLVQGKFVREFENLLEKYLGVENAIVVSSGTAALHLSLIALGIKSGDEVIVPAFTFPATANVVELVGATPILVDILLDDFCIDIQKIEEKITKKTKAIMPVHEFGQAADIHKIIDLAKKYNLFVIEDAACAIGTQFKGTKVGSFGDLGCFSFHPRKILTTGEGGTVVTNNAQLAEKLRSLRNHGIQFIDDKNDFIIAGLNYRMTDFQASMAMPQLEVLDETISFHKAQALLYNDLLKNQPLIKTPIIFDDRSNTYQTYHILLDEGVNRNQLIIKLKKQGIETNFGAQALHIVRFYKNKYNYNNEDYNNASKANTSGLALPIGRHLTNEDIQIIAHKLISTLNYAI